MSIRWLNQVKLIMYATIRTLVVLPNKGKRAPMSCRPWRTRTKACELISQRPTYYHKRWCQPTEPTRTKSRLSLETLDAFLARKSLSTPQPTVALQLPKSNTRATCERSSSAIRPTWTSWTSTWPMTRQWISWIQTITEKNTQIQPL